MITNMAEMERCFLGSFLMLAESGKADTSIKPNDFESRTYRRIFETILKQRNAGITPTIITLCNDLSPDILHSDIAELTNTVPSAANISYYENQIYKASMTRLFIRALQTAREEIDHHTEIETVIQNLMPVLAAVTTARNEAEIETATKLLRTQFSDIRWVVPGLIGEGLTLLNGAPKIGKSWFVLNLAIAAAVGGCFLGLFKAEKTETLYLALEDTKRRIHNRLKKLNAPETDNLKITTQWRDSYMGLENYLTLQRTH